MSLNQWKILEWDKKQNNKKEKKNQDWYMDRYSNLQSDNIPLGSRIWMKFLSTDQRSGFKYHGYRNKCICYWLQLVLN